MYREKGVKKGLGNQRKQKNGKTIFLLLFFREGKALFLTYFYCFTSKSIGEVKE